MVKKKLRNLTSVLYSQMSRSGNYDFPIILTSQDARQKFKFPAISCVDAVAEVLKRESLVLVQMTFDANGDANLLKSAVVNVKPIRVYLEGSSLKVCSILRRLVKTRGYWQTEQPILC